MTFKDIEIGQRFIHEQDEYTKTQTRHKVRYGFVNAEGPACYEGDSGDRHFHDEQEVERVQ